MAEISKPNRLASLDQFRGYTIIGMFLVNYLGGFDSCPRVLRHSHDYLSYADTIMPQFLFAVGFAMRLSITQRVRLQGNKGIRWRMVKRLLGLILVSLVITSVGERAETWPQLVELGWWGAIEEPLKRTWFQTLMHIAVTSLWILPVIQSGVALRWLWLIGSAGLHLWLSAWFNFEWVNTSPNGIDGGPLGFLTWTIPALVGTIVCDLFTRSTDHPHFIATRDGASVLVVNDKSRSPQRTRFFSLPVAWSFLGAFFLLALGYTLSCGTRLYDVLPGREANAQNTKLATSPVWPTVERIRAKQSASQDIYSYLAEPPFVPPPAVDARQWNYWMMSQRAATLSYLVFAAGFSWLLYIAFYTLCDVWRFESNFFRTFGTNALLAYILHSWVATAIKPFVPDDAPAWYVILSLLIFFAVTWLFVRHFEKNGYYLKV
jgi:hypothetical protein